MSTIFGDEVISDRFVNEWISACHLWIEGDKFALKDIDGGTPTGEYTIAAIRVKVVRLAGSIACVTRVWFNARETGSWVRDVNCVSLESARR